MGKGMADDGRNSLPVDEYLYVMGRTPVDIFLSFMRTQAADIPGEGHLKDPRVLVGEWRAASNHIDQLEKAEAGWADDATIGPLDPSLEPLREQVLEDPLFHHAFHLLPTEIGVVELDRLVIFQRHINLGFVRQLEERLGPAPSDAAVFTFCLPFDHPQPPMRWLRTRSDLVVFVSPSNDMRFLDSVVLRPEEITGYPPSGAVSGILGLVVGFGSNFLNAIHAENRLILNNGSHRAFALRAAGVTQAPCIIQHVSSRQEFNVVASSELKRDPDLYLTGPRPPVFKDYFDPKLRKVVPVVRKLRQVRVRFEVEETDIPAA
jgi:hypothetical protein